MIDMFKDLLSLISLGAFCATALTWAELLRSVL